MRLCESRFFVLITVVLLLAVPTVAELQVYQGNSITIQNANSTITWGRNYSFNVTMIGTNNNTLSIGNRNISVYADNDTPVNVTLWSYNLSNPSYGDTLIRLGVEPTNATVHFRFTGIPAISSDKYQLRTSSSKLDSFNNGGAVAWSYSGESSRNFTVNYEKIIHHDNGDNSGGGGSGGVPYTPSKCGLDGDVQSHSWSLVNRSSFQLNEMDNGIRSIEVETRSNQSEFKLCSKRIENSSETPQPPNGTYAVYRFKTSNVDDSQISSAKIRFEVNKNFADQYDRIVLSRYHNNWKDLPTTKTGSSDDKWVYDATSPSFSYYAVRGQNNQTQPRNNSTNKTHQPVCGDNTCNANESWKTCQQDCEKPQNVQDAENSVSKAEQQITKGQKGYQTLQKARKQLQAMNYTQAEQFAEKALNQSQDKNGNPLVLLITGLILVAVLAVAGYFGRSYWGKRQVKAEIKKIKREVHEKVNNDQVDSPRRMLSELDRAEKAMKLDDYSRAKKYLDKVERMLE